MNCFKLALAVLVSAVIATASMAQDETLVAPEGRIVGKVWHTNVRFDKSFEYMQKVREELEIPQSPLMMVMQPAGVNLSSGLPGRGDREVEMKGTLIFLQTRPTISLADQIGFELIGRPEDFEACVREHVAMMGPAAELIGADDRYEVRLDFSKLMSAPPLPADGNASSDAGSGGKPGERRQVIALAVTSDVSIGSSDPNAKRELPKSISTYYRCVDGIVYSSRTAALHHIELPTRDSLKLSDDEAAHDLFADFDLREIPQDLKRVFWSAVESQASVFLQRFDNEAAGDYSLRRAIAEGRLELLKSALFDIDRAWFTLNLSPDDVQPIKAKLRIQARENSPLAATLESLGNARSQLGMLQDEQSPLVISGTLSVPESMQPFAGAVVNSLSVKLKELLSSTTGADILVDDLMEPLQASAESGVIDAAVSLRGDAVTGIVPCGGIRIDNAEQFLSSVASVLQIAGADSGVAVIHDRIGDYQMVTIRRDAATLPGQSAPVSVQLNLAATGSWLWMTVGGERGVETLEELVTHQEQATSRDGESVPLLIRFRLDKLLGDTADPLSQVPSHLMTELERWIGHRTTPKMSISINGKQSQPATDPATTDFTSYARKVFQPENSELELKVRTASRELIADVSVGTALVKFGIAQFLDSQSRMFKGMNFDFAVPEGDVQARGTRQGSMQFRIGGSKQ